MKIHCFEETVRKRKKTAAEDVIEEILQLESGKF